MIILLFFAFLGGIITILSPCILPILPIILSSSVGGGKKRPLGIISGFIISFTFFTLFLTTIVKATGIPADTLRFISVIIIAVFGLGLVIPQIQKLFEKSFSNLQRFVPRGNQNNPGFLSGVLIGISLGLLWTPCVGPILASVISLALIGNVNGSAFLITLAYSIGTAIPMFAILIGGNKILSSNRWLLNNSEKIQRIFGVIMILTAIAISQNWDRKFQTFVLEKFPQYGTGLTSIEDNDLVQNALNQNDMDPQPVLDMNAPLAPEIIPGGEWFGSDPLTIKQLTNQGKVVLVDFWTYTCINCIRTLPYLKTWYDKYKDDGLVIIGVHTPEFEFEKSANNVAKAIADFELKYPIVQDNNYSTWRAYNNHYWPAKYLINKEGKVVYTHFGEGKYDETEKKIQQLLQVDVDINNPEYSVSSQTPETYLGYERMQLLDLRQKIAPNESKNYTLPPALSANTFALNGEWTIKEMHAETSVGSSLEFQYNAKNVYLVMSAESPNIVKVYLDDEFQKDIEVDDNKLYELINLEIPGEHKLRLEFPDGGISVYAFTFG